MEVNSTFHSDASSSEDTCGRPGPSRRVVWDKIRSNEDKS